MRRKREFEYGPLSRGIFTAMLVIMPLVAMLRPGDFVNYGLFLLVLAFGLRPFLVYSGLYRLWNDAGAGVEKKWDRKFLDKRAQDIERKVKSDGFHKSRYRDPRLPKNW